jgi:hypothetical protein
VCGSCPAYGCAGDCQREFLSVVATVEAKYGPTTALFDRKFLCDALAIEWGEFCIRYSIAIKLICKKCALYVLHTRKHFVDTRSEEPRVGLLLQMQKVHVLDPCDVDPTCENM